jgi:phasin
MSRPHTRGGTHAYSNGAEANQLHTARAIGAVTMMAQDTINIVAVADLAPTQMTVGMREVSFKRRRWRSRSSRQAADYLNKLRIPVVLGPNERQYLIDRHHLVLALREEGIVEFTVSVVANLRLLSFDDFWASLERQHWAHPFDDEGRRHSYNDMPKTIDSMQDDPFRSLAGTLKRAGGYAKDKAPYSEFKWADFLRCRMPRELVEHDFGGALAMAMYLAQGAEAAALPGWFLASSTERFLRIAATQTVSEDSSMSDPKFEVPAELRNMAERTIEQAEKAFDMFFDAANKSMAPFTHPGAEISRKVLSVTEQNMKSAFDSARRIAQATDLQEAMQIQSDFLRSQMTSAGEQMKQIADRAMSTAKDVTEGKFKTGGSS